MNSAPAFANDPATLGPAAGEIVLFDLVSLNVALRSIGPISYRDGAGENVRSDPVHFVDLTLSSRVFWKRVRVQINTLTIFIGIREVFQVGFGIINTDSHIGVMEDFADFIANRIVNPLDVQLSCQCRLNAVDDR